ncbi:MAG TPA: AMP-binding protein, partial [candidate division Zixibacteria bacterium]|nr:AMP-binding protein [candidate division Zixibacteria bacterium]
QAGFESSVRTVAKGLGIKIIEISTEKQFTDGSYQLLPRHTHTDSFNMAHDAIAEPDDTAILLHTSGTTSRPKIVPLTHRNICVAVRYICQALALGTADRCLSMMPQFHIGGLVDLLLAPLASGGSVICTSGFSTADSFFSLLKKYGPTWYQAVPATLYELITYAEREKITEISSSLRFIRSVAAPLNSQMMYYLESLFKVPVIVTYGMTEASPLITTNPLPPARRKAASVGKSVGPEIVVVNEVGKILPRGEIGEILIRGDNVISGYENNPEANDQTFHNGWFHTGDLGYLDEEEYLFLKGRLRELINRGGEKISPQEIDSILLEHPAVAQAVSFPIPHPILGEDIAVAVVLNAGKDLSKKDLVAFAAKQLAFFKVPRTVYFTDHIPKGPTGKVHRAGMASHFSGNADASLEIEYTAPRTEIEEKLVDIWTKLLRVHPVGVNDNFFDLGGDSLCVVEMFLEIENKFSHTLPLYTIFLFPTVAELSNLIEDRERDPARKLSREIQRANGIMVFWLHGSFEARDIPLIPLDTYWDKSPEIDVDGISIEEMASDYVKQIRRHKDKGPYFLGGFSIGGLIALEVARQLYDSGEEVPLLFLIDPALPGKPFETKSMRVAHYLRELSLLNAKDKLLYIRSRIGNFIRFSNLTFKKPLCKLFLTYKNRLPFFLRMYYAHRIYLQASARYHPPRYAGLSTIYLSRKYTEKRKEIWRSICSKADIHIVDTDDHIETIKPPWHTIWLKDLQEKLNTGRR